MWIEKLKKLGAAIELHPSITLSELQIAEERLGLAFPEPLRAILRETNGVEGEYGLALLWPLESIVKQNLQFRNEPSFKKLYMPFDNFLFFGDAGNGDQFGFPIVANGTIPRNDIFAWNHEDDSRVWVAPSLALYFEWWVSGKIQL